MRLPGKSTFLCFFLVTFLVPGSTFVMPAEAATANRMDSLSSTIWSSLLNLSTSIHQTHGLNCGCYINPLLSEFIAGAAQCLKSLNGLTVLLPFPKQLSLSNIQLTGEEVSLVCIFGDLDEIYH